MPEVSEIQVDTPVHLTFTRWVECDIQGCGVQTANAATKVRLSAAVRQRHRSIGLIDDGLGGLRPLADDRRTGRVRLADQVFSRRQVIEGMHEPPEAVGVVGRPLGSRRVGRQKVVQRLV
jgi:hypothetical protein